MLFLDMAAAFLIGGLGGMGVGGGTLLVIYLTLVHGTPQLVTQGTNLLFFLFSAGAALPFHLRRRLPLRLLALCTAAALPAAIGGSLLAAVIPTGTVRTLFALLLLFSGGSVFLRRSGRDKAGNPPFFFKK